MITREQAFKIIGLFQTAYKESYRNSTPEEIEQKAAIYRDILQDCTFEQVQAGIRVYMSEDHQYEPKPGQIIARIWGKTARKKRDLKKKLSVFVLYAALELCQNEKLILTDSNAAFYIELFGQFPGKLLLISI